MMSRIEWMTSSPPTPKMVARGSVRSRHRSTTFMNPCVSPFSTARPTRVMGRLPTNAFRPDLRTSSTVQACPPKRRVDVEGVGRDPVTHPARGSSSRRLAATISKSLVEVCVKAPRPLQSPMAQM